jgi:hypothetical protein
MQISPDLALSPASPNPATNQIYKADQPSVHSRIGLGRTEQTLPVAALDPGDQCDQQCGAELGDRCEGPGGPDTIDVNTRQRR